MNFLDGEGGIFVPKSVRPIIDYKESFVGSKKGAKRQFRRGNLHIREYENYYTLHMDKADPTKDPVGHLLKDAPEYLLASLIGLKAIQHNACRIRKSEDSRVSINDFCKVFQAGTSSAIFSYAVSSLVKQINWGT